jgi:hypothetical protein
MGHWLTMLIQLSCLWRSALVLEICCGRIYCPTRGRPIDALSSVRKHAASFVDGIFLKEIFWQRLACSCLLLKGRLLLLAI